MADGYKFLGSMTLGKCVPIALEAQAAVLPEFEAKLAGALDMEAALKITPPTIGGQLEVAYEAVANLEASIGMPSASLDLSGVAAILADLRASLAFWVSLSATLGTPGVYAWTYSGPAGGAVPGGLPDAGASGPTAPVNGVLFLATDAGAWASMQACFAT